MNKLNLITKPIKEKEVVRDWHLIDVKGKILGRVVPQIAIWLQGKHKSNYVPYLDMGDYVVVINAQKIAVTGKKSKNKIYTYYSGYPGGLKKIFFEKMIQEKPQEIIRHAVSGMLPKNKLRDTRLTRLFVFPDERHPYQEKFKNLPPTKNKR
ncbi:MAG: 50S ribosomal protein L13 [Microgenomates group bacterium]|nr:50S ribosomal protein L13 [Microgenomates group bacterium]